MNKKNSKLKTFLKIGMVLLLVLFAFESTSPVHAKKKKDEGGKSRFEQKYGMKKTQAQVKERQAARREGRQPAKMPKGNDWDGWDELGGAASSGTSVAKKREQASGTGSGWYMDPWFTNSGCAAVAQGGEVDWAGCGIDISQLTQHQIDLLNAQAAIASNSGLLACVATRASSCGAGCSCDDCGWRECSGVPLSSGGSGGGRVGGGGCTLASPAKPNLLSPPDGGSVSEGEVQLHWNLSGWGTSCTAAEGAYFLYFGEYGESLDVFSVSTPRTNVTYDVNVEDGKTYEWFVVANNGVLSNSSDRYRFTVGSLINVTGYIWDATEQACSLSDKESRELTEGSDDGDLSSSVAVTAAGISGSWDPDAYTGFSYRVSGVGAGTGQTLCATLPDPVGMPNSKFALSCLNNSDSGIISGSCANVDIDSANSIFDLGFILTSSGWFQSIGGDVYGGCTEDNCVASVNVSLPEAADILGGFADSLIDSVGTLFANSDLTVEGDRYSEDDNRHLKYISSDFWPHTFSFRAPSSAVEVSDCGNMFNGNLDTADAYVASRSCVQDGLDNVSGDYSLSSDGIAIVFVEGDGSSLVFNDAFRSSSNSQRVMFISEAAVEVDASVGSASPTPSSSPDIQASIVSEMSISFPSVGATEDTTVIVEGPLVTKDGSVEFERNRLLNNGYPSEVVVYNPIYLTAMQDVDHSAVRVVDISWLLSR